MATGMKSGKRKRKFARKVVKKVPKTIRQYVAKAITGAAEPKYTQTLFSAVPVGPTAAGGSFYNDMTMPAQGVAFNQRIGDRIKMKSAQISCSCVTQPYSTSVTGPTTQVRFIVVYIPNSNVITSLASLESDLFAATVSGSYFHAHLQANKIVTVLMDRRYTAKDAGSGSRTYTIRKTLRLKTRVEFAPGLTNSLEKGRLGVYFCSDSVATDCTMSGSIKWNYIDL